MGYPENKVREINQNAVDRVRRFVAEWRSAKGQSAEKCPVILAAEIGPRGDGYSVEKTGNLTPDVAYEYHKVQIGALAEAGVDLVFALTMTHAQEAVGIARAAEELEVPLVISPTVETDGHLPDGSPLGRFFSVLDKASGSYPLFYMINCAYPTHVEGTLQAAKEAGEAWLTRFRGLRANASSRSHEELDNSTKLDRGNPRDLAQRLVALKSRYELSVLGGCCGTDAEHIQTLASLL